MEFDVAVLKPFFSTKIDIFSSNVECLLLLAISNII